MFSVRHESVCEEAIASTRTKRLLTEVTSESSRLCLSHSVNIQIQTSQH
ncbi:hypothetical protein J41TS12_33280 [Paenibacillus antibioticophila]|uniref:Uncharacterized protein n=1 Tax=Paenibacillus antibioticophila TaxID=1274374 RepID=A0A919XXK5_9BACL|nr:hypothetical protein J41TS12_33280 [Paenibacillus antibioticophila]